MLSIRCPAFVRNSVNKIIDTLHCSVFVRQVYAARRAALVLSASGDQPVRPARQVSAATPVVRDFQAALARRDVLGTLDARDREVNRASQVCWYMCVVVRRCSCIEQMLFR